MKKIHFLALAAAVSLGACTSVSDENTQDVLAKSEITFGSYVDMNSRALDKSAFATGDVIGVNAFQSGSVLNGDFTNNFMENESLTKTTTGKWDYNNPKFWPVNATDRISFVATYPKIAPTITDGTCAFDFSVSPSAPAQEDFLWSTITDAHRNDRNGTFQNGILEEPATTPITNVVLHFKHALSRIIFSAKAATYYSGTTITVTDIVLNNLYGAGTYTIPANLGKGTWGMKGDQNNSYVALQNGTGAVMDTYYTTLGSSLLLVPQTLLTNETLEKASTVTIKYTVCYAAPAMTIQEEKTFPLATTGLLNGTTWEQDKIYNYKFNIALDMITFDAVVDNWGSSEDSDFTVE